MVLTTPHLAPRFNKEYSYTSTLPLGLLGLLYGDLYLSIHLWFVFRHCPHWYISVWNLQGCGGGLLHVVARIAWMDWGKRWRISVRTVIVWAGIWTDYLQMQVWCSAATLTFLAKSRPVVGYVYIRVNVCVCMYVCMCLFIYLCYVCMYVCMYICMYICM